MPLHTHIYIYIYGTPQKKTMFTSLLLVFAICCVYFGLPFDPVFFWGVPYIYIDFCARRLHDLFVHFGRNAVRMRSMHSECIPAQYQDQDPRFAQKSCGKSWKYQDPRSKIPARLLAKILEVPRSKILASSLVGILDLGISKILARSLAGILDLGSWYFQDFPQDFCANLGSWSWYWAGMHSLAFSGVVPHSILINN